MFFQSRSLRNAGGFFFCVKIWTEGILVLYLTQQTKQTKVMRYNNKQEKAQQVAELTANVPVGTRMDVMSKRGESRLIAQCVVEKVTKSGNIVLSGVGGQVQYKTKFHFQKLSLDFYGQPQKFDLTDNGQWFVQVAK